MTDSRSWLEGVAAVMEMSYEELMSKVEHYLQTGEAWQSWDYSVPDKFWDHYTAVTGTPMPDDGGDFIGCCC